MVRTVTSLVTTLLRLAAVLALVLAGWVATPPAVADQGLRDFLAVAGSAADLCAPGEAGTDAHAHAHACCLIVAASFPDLRAAPHRVRLAMAWQAPPTRAAGSVARYPAWQGRAPPVV